MHSPNITPQAAGIDVSTGSTVVPVHEEEHSLDEDQSLLQAHQLLQFGTPPTAGPYQQIEVDVSYDPSTSPHAVSHSHADLSPSSRRDRLLETRILPTATRCTYYMVATFALDEQG